MIFSIWNIVGIIAIIALMLSLFIGKNAIWGTFGLGIVIAIILGFIFKTSTGFNWQLAKNVLIVSVLIGAFFEIVGRILNVNLKK